MGTRGRRRRPLFPGPPYSLQRCDVQPKQDRRLIVSVLPSQGLSSTQAAELLAQHGPNALTPPKETPEIIKFLKQMVGGFSLLLWVGAILCWIAFGIQYASDKSSSLDSVSKGLRSGPCLAVLRTEPWVGPWAESGVSSH